MRLPLIIGFLVLAVLAAITLSSKGSSSFAFEGQAQNKAAQAAAANAALPNPLTPGVSDLSAQASAASPAPTSAAGADAKAPTNTNNSLTDLIGGDASNAGVDLDLSKTPTLSESEKALVKTYLINTSALPFPSPNYVKFALLQQRDGQGDAMKEVIGEINTNLPKLQALTPPSSLVNFHQQSIASLQTYVALLQKVSAAPNAAAMLTVLTNTDFNKLRQQGQGAIVELRALVAKNNIQLSTEVLPDTPLPPINPPSATP